MINFFHSSFSSFFRRFSSPRNIIFFFENLNFSSSSPSSYVKLLIEWFLRYSFKDFSSSLNDLFLKKILRIVLFFLHKRCEVIKFQRLAKNSLIERFFFFQNDFFLENLKDLLLFFIFNILNIALQLIHRVIPLLIFQRFFFESSFSLHVRMISFSSSSFQKYFSRKRRISSSRNYFFFEKILFTSNIAKLRPKIKD